jgi:hypothetical protein
MSTTRRTQTRTATVTATSTHKPSRLSYDSTAYPPHLQISYHSASNITTNTIILPTTDTMTATALSLPVPASACDHRSHSPTQAYDTFHHIPPWCSEIKSATHSITSDFYISPKTTVTTTSLRVELGSAGFAPSPVKHAIPHSYSLSHSCSHVSTTASRSGHVEGEIMASAHARPAASNTEMFIP